MAENIICDLDGTLCDTAHRVHFLQQQPKNWDGWNAGCVQDGIVEPVRLIIRALSGWNHFVWFLTGRSDAFREETEAWLDKHIPLEGYGLVMRKDGDHRDDVIVKLEMAAREGLTPANTLMVLEDRSRVVKAWREAGFFCAQVRDGDF